ncbi:MAG: protein kinase [Acidobacteriia bacterium]|nr:protein kinase [Terriglobia bacterium]
MALVAGTRLGPYEILSALGAGGMGEVYRARDTRLGRTVAVKVLPRDRMVDAERRQRFLQEARSASALNHPNIITLHDIARDGETDFLVMEYVPGQSLDGLMSQRRLTPIETRQYAAEIASALAAAHGAGIVHRDIKPANIMIQVESDTVRVKVLDFGLAKLVDSAVGPDKETREREAALTKPGAVMGTLAYMSPEQARGETLDARTDLFSFGAVLFEMATGRQAFPTAFDWTPPPVQELPPPLRPIVLKLLEPDRELRYQTAADVSADLKRLQRSTEAPGTTRRWWIAAAAAATVVALAAAGVVLLRPRPPARPDQWVRLTNFPDSVSQPALSPDGRMLAFVRGPDTFAAEGEIYVKILPDGEAVQVTRDGLRKMSPTFSADGSQIAYTVNDPFLNWDTWVVPVPGGQPRLWMRNASGLTWFGKQGRIAFSEVKDADIHMGIVTSQESRSDARDVYVPSGVRDMAHRSYPSPDGKSMLVVEMARGDWQPCRLVSLDGGPASRQVGPSSAACTSAAWSPDGKSMYLTTNASGSFQIWRQPFPHGQPQQVTSGPTEAEGIAMAPDGRSLITAVAQRQSVVWLHESKGDRQISSEGYSFDPKFTPDGRSLIYRILKGTLAASDSSELRLVDLESGRSERLLSEIPAAGLLSLAYDISSDAQHLVIATDNDRGPLWLAALDRRSPPHLIPGVQGGHPLFGAGGDILFNIREGASRFAYRMKQDGSGREKVLERPIAGVRGMSPDGQWLIVRAPEGRGTVALAVPTTGGDPIPILAAASPDNVDAAQLRWPADGRQLFVSFPTTQSLSTSGHTYIVELRRGQMFPDIPAGGFKSEAEIAALPGTRRIEVFDVAPGPSPDTYAFSQGTTQRNLYRIPLP